MQIKKESFLYIENSRLAEVHRDDVKDGIFNCPDEVEVVWEDAFSSCKELITVVNLNKVKYIAPGTFTGFPNLIMVNAPEVEEVGFYAFSYCQKLIRVNLPKATIIGIGTFEYCVALTVVNIPQVKEIMNKAFDCCSKLATIDLPKVAILGPQSFSDCSELTTINALQLEEVGDDAFLNCKKLVMVNLSKVTIIKEHTFHNCTQLTTLILHPAVKLDVCKSLCSDLRYLWENLEKIIINDLENPDFDKNIFISQLPSHLKKIEIVLASHLLTKNSWYVKEILKQHINIRDIETHIFSFSRQLLFFSKVEEQPFSYFPPCSII